MKILQCILLLVLSLSFACTSKEPTRIMTYNIRFDNPNDNENWWEHRKHDIVDLLQSYQPDIFGIQEGVHKQVQFLDSILVEYNFIGVGRDDGKTKGEFTALFFDIRKFNLLNGDTFWLSETPDSVSVGWDGSMERICTYGRFLNLKTKDTLVVFNAHFDHIGEQARKESAKLILHKIKELRFEKSKVAVLGDFNSIPSSDPIEIFKSELHDALEVSQQEPGGPTGTFNSFQLDHNLNARIDYVMMKNLNVLSYKAIDDKRENGLWPSDHLPILVEIE